MEGKGRKYRALKRVLLLSYGKIETLGTRSKVLLQDGCLYSRRFYEAESQTHSGKGILGIGSIEQDGETRDKGAFEIMERWKCPA